MTTSWREDRRAVLLVARREVLARLRSKEFQFSTAVSLAVIGVIVLIAASTADDGGETYEIGIAGERPTAVGSALEELGTMTAAAASGSTEVDVHRFESVARAEGAVRRGDVDAAVVDDPRTATGTRIVVESELDERLAALLVGSHRQGSPEAEADTGSPPVRLLDPVDQEDEDRKTLVLVGSFLLYAQLLGYGYWVASAIVDEKSSRVIELLLAKTRPSALLTGKILGVGVVWLTTLLAYVTLGLGAAAVTGAVDLRSGTGLAAVQVVAWFLLGFLLYSCVFAIGGALASRPDELQNSGGPFGLVMMASFLAAGPAADDPGGTVARIATLVPTTAPLVMPIRQASGELPIWEMTLGIVLVLAAVAAIVPLTARIYAGGALFTRGPLKLRQALTLDRPPSR